MKKEKRVKGANILPLSSKREEHVFDPSEVARDLFAETWRIYLDEPPIKSVSIRPASGADFSLEEKNLKMDQSERPLRLYFKD